MGFVLDTIKRSAMIIKRAFTKDSEPRICKDVIPESEFEDMLKVIEMDSIDNVEDNDIEE